VPGQSALRFAEHRRHRRVDVEVNLARLSCALSDELDPVLGHEIVERADGLVVEATEVAVHGVQARDDASRQMNEHRIRAERFEMARCCRMLPPRGATAQRYRVHIARGRDALMTYEGSTALPVVSDDGRVVGLLSSLDILRWLALASGYVVGHPPSAAP
jgi:hypothetical protein